MYNLDELSSDSRVWIYQSDRKFTDAEVAEINPIIESFCDQWAAHGTQLKAFGKLYYNTFVVLIVDESQEPASGCSIDSSVGMVRKLMADYKVDFLNRMIFSYKTEDGVELASREDFAKLYENGTLNDDSIVFNNLVKDKGEMDAKWEVKLSESWHKQMV